MRTRTTPARQTAMRAGDVRRYGAIGDGRSHPLSELYADYDSARATHPWLRADTWQSLEADYAAARTALAQVAVNKEVFFPAGTWMMKAGLSVPVSGVAIYGEGGATTLQCDLTGPSRQDFLFTAIRQDDVIFRDLKIAGVHAGGIGIQHARGCRVLRCDISGATLPNTTGFCTGILVMDVTGLEIDRCDLHGNGASTGEGHCDIFANGGTYRIQSSRITNNRCLSSRVNSNIALFDPIGVYVAGNETSGAVESPVDRGRQGYGICLYRTAPMRDPVGDCQVVDNYVHDVRGTGIYAQDVPTCAITNNVVIRTGAGQTDGTLAVAGIVVEGRNSICRGNIVHESSKCGICVTISAFGSVVMGNVVRDSAFDGIALRNTISDVQVTDNVVENTGRIGIGSFQGVDVAQARITISNNTIRTLTTRGVSIGVFAAPSTTEWIVTSNRVTGADGRPYAIGGTGHVVTGNRAEAQPWPGSGD